MVNSNERANKYLYKYLKIQGGPFKFNEKMKEMGFDSPCIQEIYFLLNF